MKNIWIIAKREFQTFFDSLVAYILLVAFLGFAGFFTWLYGNDVFVRGQTDLRIFFAIAPILFTIFIPALTMRMIAEEKKTGTLEVLLTRAVSDWEVIAGKYLACMMLVGIALFFTLPYYLTVAWLGPIDHGATIFGYIGLLFLGSAFTGIGLFASSITENQIEAFLLGLIICLCFNFIFTFLADAFSGLASELMNYLDFRAHFESIARGVLDIRDLIFFTAMTLLGLILAESQLARRNIVD